MLRRLKNAKPRYKILIGLWLAFELISLPAAASVAFSFTGKSAPLVAEPIETTEPGTSQFLVSYSVPFDILVSGVKKDVNVLIEDVRDDEAISSSCASFVSHDPRVVKTIDASSELDAPIAAIFVTISHDPAEHPDISFKQISFAPPALPCQQI